MSPPAIYPSPDPPLKSRSERGEYRIKILDNQSIEDHSSWEHFVGSHPAGTFFQTPWYYQLFLNTRKTRPVALLAVDATQQIRGVLVCVIHSSRNSWLSYVTTRSVTMGGPLAENNDPLMIRELLQTYEHYVSTSGVIYSQFRNLTDPADLKPLFNEEGYALEDHLNILIDLTLPVETLWEDVYPKRRNEIRKGEKKGLTFHRVESGSDVEASISTIQKLYRRLKIPVFEKNVFYAVYHKLVPLNLAQFFSARYQGKLIGTMIVFCYNNRVYNWFAGSDPHYLDQSPNDFLPWNVLQWSKHNGFSLFDWGGAGKPDVPYGVREYKKQFGGVFVQYGRFEKIHKPILYSLSARAFRVSRKFRRIDSR